MKRLLIALAAAVAMLTASARVTVKESFELETGFGGFDRPEGDESELVAYDNDEPGFVAPYDFTGFGDKYLSLDTGDATLWRTNTAAGNVYFDMALQFNPSASELEVEAGDPTKILLYMNAESNLVILAGTSSSDRTPTNYVTNTKLAPGTWARVTVSSKLENGCYAFTVRLNGTVLKTAGDVDSFPSLTDDDTITQVGFSGSGALDDFVARTTDPYYEGPIGATIGSGDWCEKYPTYERALVDALTGTPAAIKISGVTDPVDGSAEHPYLIPNAACLKALQDAVIANPAARSLHYIQTQNIDMTNVTGFYGIGWFTSSDAYASLPPGVANKQNVFFEGVYDGNGKTLSNVEIVRHNYAGIFNCISNATIENLTVSNVTFSGTCAEEGFAIVGNSYGASVLENLTSDGTWPADMRHNAAGIAIRVQDDAIITGCVNRVDIATTGKRLGGILAFSEDTSGSGAGTQIYNCTNYGDLSSSDGSRGVAGILARPEAANDKTTIGNCTNFGSLSSGSNVVGQIVGQLDPNTYTDDGGNTFLASASIVGDYNNKTVNGLAYALPTTISETEYLTTVAAADLAAGNTYTLLANVAAGTVYTFDAAGTIAFNTNGYNFAGSVAVANPNMLDVETATAGETVTFTAVGGVAVAQITKGEPETTTQYNTLAKAITAAASGDTVTLVADSSEDVIVNKSITFVESGNATFYGTFDGSGTVAMTAKPKKYTSTTIANGATLFAHGWTGTFKICWDSDASARFVFNDFGNEHSKIEIGVDFNDFPSGAWGAGAQGDGAPRISSAIVLSANWTIPSGGGWSGSTTYIPKLSGNGNFSVAANYDRTYEIGCIDGYTGALKTSPGLVQGKYGHPYIKIGDIVKAGVIGFETCLVAATSTVADVTFCSADLASTTVNSESQILAFGVVNGSSGIYLARASATIDGVLTGFVSVQDAIDAGAAATGNATVPTVTVYDESSETFSDWVYDNGVYTYGKVRAKIGETPYVTLTAAIDAAGAEAATEIELVGDCSEAVTISDGITVSVMDDVVFSGKLSGAGAIRYTKAPASFDKAKLLADDWTGTYVADYAINRKDFNFNAYGTVNSKVEIAATMNGSPINADVETTVKVSGVLDLSDGYTSNRVHFEKVTGDGVIVFSADKDYTICQLVDWNGIITNNFDYIHVSNVLSGAGTIIYNRKPNKDAYLPVASAGWTGTVNLNYANIVTNADFAAKANACGVAGSVVEIGENGSAFGYLNDNVDTKLKVSGYMEIDNGSSTTKRSISTLTGDGTVVFKSRIVSNNQVVNYAVSNLVEWDGVITNESSAVYVTNIVSGSGTIVANVKPTVNPTIGSGWEGTFVADWAGANDVQFDINAYGNENSVVEVTKLAGGYVSGSNANVTVVPTVNVSGSMLLDNGYSGKITTFTKLTGSGAFSNKTYTVNVTTLDNFTGMLTPLDSFGMSIGTISLDAVPESGSKVVSLGEGANIRAIADTKVSVGGVQQDIELEVIEGAEGYGIYVKDNTVYVAQIGANKFATLAEAVAAAQAGDTITLLGNLELDARVEPNKTMTFDLGGYTLSRTGTGGNGSVIDVKGGDVTITNGVIDCTQDDTVIVADGVYALTVRSGATLTLNDLTVTVDSQAGACVYPFAGATVTILGGTYGNNTADAYQYHADWTGMAVNQANVSQQLITIRGGRFYKVDPSLGDDSELVDTFLAEGYESKKDGDYWVVSEKSSEPLEPGQSSESYPTPEAAAAAAAGVEITVPKAVSDELDSAAQTTYKAMFEKKVVSDGKGGYKVEVALTAAAEAATQTQADADAAKVIDDLTEGEVTLTTTPGLYYSFKYGTSLDNMTEGARTLATGSSLELARPTTENATAGFYKVLVNVTDK